MIREVHGFEVVCDGCEQSYGIEDDIGILFDTADLARTRIEHYGWTVTRDQVRCGDCLAANRPEGMSGE